MHRAVLQNRTYIRFAAKNTVEVISMEELDRAVERKEHVATYTVKTPYGDEVEQLVEFPGLTIDQLRDLSNGPAIRYMEGGRIPYTAIVDPHDLKELEGIRGTRTARELVAAVKRHAKALETRYGPGVDRKLWNLVSEGGIAVDVHLGKDDIVQAMAVYRHLGARTVRQPDSLQRRVEAIRDTIVAVAAKRLDALEKASGAEASRELAALARALRDTKLEERALRILQAKK